MSGRSIEDFDVDSQLTRLMRRSRAATLTYLPRIHPSLDYASYLVLMAIEESDREHGVRGSDLADVLEVHKSTISRTVAHLERLELIERVQDPTDGRAQLLVVANETRHQIETIRRERHARLAKVLIQWSERDLDDFARLLSEFNAGIEDLPARA